MADQKIDIDIVTKQSGDGAKKTAEDVEAVKQKVVELGKVTKEQAETAAAEARYEKQRAKDVEKATAAATKATQDAAKAQAQLGAASDRATAGKASKFKAVGDAIKNGMGGGIESAIGSLQQLGPKIAGIGAVAIAAVASLKAVAAAVKRFADAALEAKKADIEMSIRNTSEAAASAAKNFEKMEAALARTAERRTALAGLAKEMADLAEQTERQSIASNRTMELAAATDDIDRARINKKYDEQSAAVDSRSRGRAVEGEAERINLEKQRLEEENENLRKGIKADKRTVGQLLGTAQQAGEEGDKAMPRWATPGVDLFGWDTKKMNTAKGFYAQQDELTGKAGETVAGMQTKADQIKANNQALADLEARKNAIIPAMGDLNAAMDRGGQVDSAAAGVGIRRMEQERAETQARAAREAAAAAEKEAAARSAYEHGGSNLNDARGSVGNAEENYSSAPSVGSAKALQEAKAALKEQEKTFKELASALSQAARENARHAKTAKADLSAE